MTKPVFTLAFVLSLLAAYTLHFYPLRGDLGYWRPMVVFLVAIYWLLREPHQLGLGFAWLVGLALDILSGGILGQRALALLVCAYLVKMAGERFQHFSLWHQVLVVLPLAVIFQLVVIVVYLLAGRGAETWRMFLPLLTTVPLWPILAGLLNRAQRRE
ncbi:MAG: rod shape-determining protein MreD [Porticoccaceae bacterium]|jgi:rod shape-determining protein MreD